MPLNIPRPPSGLPPGLQGWVNTLAFELERFGREPPVVPMFLDTVQQIDAREFGIKADGPISTSARPGTDNTAALNNLFTWMNTRSADVILPEGVIAYHATSLTGLRPQGGSLYGGGSNSGGAFLTESPYGTILRNLDATGDDIVIENSGSPSAYGFRMGRLAIWPRLHKTSGYAINVTNSFNLQLDDITIWYPFRGINDGGNTYLIARNVWINNVFGENAVYISGYDGVNAGVSGGGRSYYYGIQGVNTNPVNPQLPSPGAAFVFRTWPGALAKSSGDFIAETTNGVIWQVATAGTLAAAAPTLSSPWKYSDDLATVAITSGSATLKFYAKLGSNFFVIDSGAVGNVIDGCSPTQGGGSFLVIQDTIGAVGVAPKQNQVVNFLGNSFWQDTFKLLAGSQDQIVNSQGVNSVAGPVLSIGAAYTGPFASSNNFYTSGGNSSGESFSVTIADGPLNISFSGDHIDGAPGGAGGTAAISVANTGTIFSGVTIGERPAGPSKYGMQLETTASGVQVDQASRVVGSTAAYNNLSTNDQIGIPVPWTPQPTFGGLHAGMTFSARTGTYTHRPGWLEAQFDFTMSAKGSSTGAAQMNIPIAISQPGAGCIGYSINMAGLTSAITGQVAGGTMNFGHTGAGGVSNLDDTNFTNTSQINGIISGPLTPP